MRPEEHQGYFPLGERTNTCTWGCDLKGTLVVMKQYRHWDEHHKNVKPMETYILRKALDRQPHITQCLSPEINRKNELTVVYPYYRLGSLDKLVIRGREGERSEAFLWNVFNQMASALAFLR